MMWEQDCTATHRATETEEAELARGSDTSSHRTGPPLDVPEHCCFCGVYWRRVGKDCLEKKWALESEASSTPF